MTHTHYCTALVPLTDEQTMSHINAATQQPEIVVHTARHSGIRPPQTDSATPPDPCIEAAEWMNRADDLWQKLINEKSELEMRLAKVNETLAGMSSRTSKSSFPPSTTSSAPPPSLASISIDDATWPQLTSYVISRSRAPMSSGEVIQAMDSLLNGSGRKCSAAVVYSTLNRMFKAGQLKATGRHSAKRYSVEVK